MSATATGEPLKAPFPWFGGKSRAASLLWPRFGDVANYVEPFFGSGAVLLARPHAPRIETVNDMDGFLANFWRAIAADPEGVAAAADWPVNETDLHARHRWLVNRVDFRARMLADPEHFDVKIAGWWVWGLCAWIGSGWCSAEAGGNVGGQLPFVGGGVTQEGHGIHSKAMRGPAVQLPRIGGSAGGGNPRPEYGVGIHAAGMRGPSRRGGLSEQLPHLGGGGVNETAIQNYGRGIHNLTTRSRILETFQALSARLRGVRVACGDFERILSDSVTWRHGTTAVLLDPPYADGEDVYSAGDDARGTFARAAAWATEHGADQRLRIALCGYEGTWSPPSGWSTVAWKAKGGYGGQRGEGKAKNDNANRERIWCSPGCLRVDAVDNAGPLFTRQQEAQAAE